MTNTKPRDAGEVARQATRVVVTTDVLGCPRQDVDQTHATAILTAWRREIETAMVERVAEWVGVLNVTDVYKHEGQLKLTTTRNTLADTIRARFGGGDDD